MKTALAFGLLAIGLAGCTKKESDLKLNYLKSFEVSAVCQEIHVKQPFEYDGKINVIEVNSSRRPTYVLTTGYASRLKKTNVGAELVQQAQNPRLYLPPTSVSFDVESDELPTKSTVLLTGSARTDGDGKTLMDCTVKIEREVPTPK